MQAITVRDRDAGIAGLSLTELPYPAAAENDVSVRVHSAGFTPWGIRLAGHLTDRVGHDRTPSVHGHELSGVVVELGVRHHRLEGRPAGVRPGRLDPQRHARRAHSGGGPQPRSAVGGHRPRPPHPTGQTVLAHGAAGGVGSIAVQLAREVDARVIGTGRPSDRCRALAPGVDTFLDLQTEKLEDAGEVDVVFDVNKRTGDSS
jgi:NADPH:quinone reductase-like Zn-dependent oxidoreductase